MAATRAPTRFNGGIDIDGVHFLVGSGVPGGTTPTDGAGVGSSYQDTSNGGQYSKKTAGSGTDKWIQAATEDAATWRAPVTAVDVTLRANVAAAVTAANVADTVDGATIASGSRVLLTNLTAGNENIYVVSGSTAAWVFTEDANSATDADAVLVQDGTVYAETKFVFDGTNWVDSTVSSATKSATSNAVTTITTVDSELVDTFQVVRWLVTAQSVGTPANNYSAVIMCCHDGSSGADAVNVSYTASNELIPNTLPTGLSFTVDLDGVTTSQVVRLRCVSTDSVNVKAVRMAL